MFTIIGADGKEYGPVAADQIRAWMAQHRLTPDMQARRVGDPAWTRLGDLPEFAAAHPVAIGPAGATGGSDSADTAAAPAAMEPQPIVFTGAWPEYFRIWIVNVLLTIVTFGIYAAWAKVRKRRYFCANTVVLGHCFEYLADPKKILLGNVIVAVLFGFLLFSQVVSLFLYVGVLAVFAIVMPWMIVRALAFNARNTAWRGLCFNFTGRYGEAATAFLLWPLLLVPSLGLILPLVAKKQKEFVVGRSAFGTTPFQFGGRTEDYYRIYGISALFFLPAIVGYFGFVFSMFMARGGAQPGMTPALIGVLLIIAIPLALIGTFYFRSRMFNYVWNHTSIAGNAFIASMRGRDLFVLHLVNSLVTLVTVGLMHPWTVVRTVKFQTDSLHIVPSGNLDAFVAAAQPAGDAVGDAASDFFDFDLGFGL